jgi:tight adherence protein C
MNLFILEAVALASVAIGTFSVVYAAAAAPTHPGKRLGLRGLKRQRALEQVPFWRQLEPVVRWLGARFSGVLSDAQRERLDRKISLAGDYIGLAPEEAVALSALSALGGLLMGKILGSLSGLENTLLFAFTLLGAAIPYFRITSAIGDRMKDVSRRLPHTIDLLALSMGAGLDFPGAVRQVVEKSGRPDEPIVEEFTLLLQSLELGRTRRQALEELAQRVPVDSVLEFVGSVIQAELRGNPLVTVLRIQADVSRRKRTVRAEESAAKAGVAMMAPLVLVFFSILILLVAPIIIKLQGSLG